MCVAQYLISDFSFGQILLNVTALYKVVADVESYLVQIEPAARTKV